MARQTIRKHAGPLTSTERSRRYRAAHRMLAREKERERQARRRKKAR